MNLDELKEQVWSANRALGQSGLVVLTWGNVSGIDRKAGIMAIKPSGVEYKRLTQQSIVLVSLANGEVRDGVLRPSSDTPSHLALYRSFDSIGSVVHTHSVYATSWAQAEMDIPCFGTTHADYFHGPIPVTRQLEQEEIKNDYEHNVGKVIAEHFTENRLSPIEIPAVLVPGHGVFTWGETADKALETAIVLEEVARMAVYTRLLNPRAEGISALLLDKHFFRKHGSGAYYGQEQ